MSVLSNVLVKFRKVIYKVLKIKSPSQMTYHHDVETATFIGKVEEFIHDKDGIRVKFKPNGILFNNTNGENPFLNRENIDVDWKKEDFE